MTQGANNQYVQAKSEKAQNELFHKTENKTAQAIAHEHGIGRETVKRAAKFSKGVDAAEKIESGAREAILSGTSKVPKNIISNLPKMEPEEQREVIAAAKSGSSWPTKKVKNGANGLKWRKTDYERGDLH